MNEHSQDGTVPKSPLALRSRIVIRPSGRVWSLEDERRQVGGVFVSLEAALAFARTEQLHGAGAIDIVVGERARPVNSLRAA